MQNQMSFTRKVVQQIKRRITPLYYEVVYGLITPPNVTTMNWGYAPVTESLRPRHPNGNESLQYELYWQTFSQLDQPLTADQVVCEISSGRGGGLAFLRSLTSAQVIGLERSPAACRYAQKHFALEVCAASALHLPLRDASVDVFVSVEAAHNYHHDAFIAEIARCLKPGGMIVLADMNYGPVHRVQLKLTDFYARNGLNLDKWRDIRTEVIQALEQDEPRKRGFLQKVPWPLRSEARAYMCTLGSHKHLEVVRDERAYFIMRARK